MIVTYIATGVLLFTLATWTTYATLLVRRLSAEVNRLRDDLASVRETSRADWQIQRGWIVNVAKAETDEQRKALGEGIDRATRVTVGYGDTPEQADGRATRLALRML